MTDMESASAVAGADERTRPVLPDGEYAIVEVLGHRALIGRVSEVERFGAKLMAIEPLYQGALLEAVLIGGGSIYQFTPCSREVAARRSPTRAYQLPASVQLTLPKPVLPGPSDDDEDLDFAPAFLTNGDDGQ